MPFVRAGLTLVALVFASTLQANGCGAPAGDMPVLLGDWGMGSANHRFVDGDLSLEQAPELLWAFNLGSGDRPHSQPAVTTDTVYVGNERGELFALGLEDGCLRWRRELDGDIRTAIVVGALEGRRHLFLSTGSGSVYALDAITGETRWRVRADPHPQSMLTGSPLLLGGQLLVPVSSYEMVAAILPVFPCCRFRGSVVALDPASGAPLWRRYTIDEPATQQADPVLGLIPRWGPSGAPIWSTPAADAAGATVYVGTGENYTDPVSPGSDAIHAIDAITGERRWLFQAHASDRWNMACDVWPRSNCPKSPGPDFDFGAPPIWVELDDERWILAGQKSGLIYGLNADTGEMRWRQRAGRGGKLGGVHWGMAVDKNRGVLYVPISDRDSEFFEFLEVEGGPQPGMVAVDIRSGEIRWRTLTPGACDAKADCHAGQSAAIVALGAGVISGGLDGVLRGFAAEDGRELWQIETWRNFPDAIRGEVQGGAIDVHGPVVAGDYLLLSSGYGSFEQGPGNVFLVYRFRNPGPN